jgi:hypothetical protein
MPRPSSRILELARKGAEHRYQELKTEVAELVKDFPHLAEQAGTALGTAAGRAEASVRKIARRGRGMSAAARRAVSERMKAYWAARRKKKSGTKRR